MLDFQVLLRRELRLLQRLLLLLLMPHLQPLLEDPQQYSA
jgi:hypothetical protein